MAEWLAPDLKSGDPELQVRIRVNSSGALVYSQLVFFLPVGILNTLSLFDLFVLLWRVVTEVRIYIYTSHQKFEQDREVKSGLGSIWDSTFLNMQWG